MSKPWSNNDDNNDNNDNNDKSTMITSTSKNHGNRNIVFSMPVRWLSRWQMMVEPARAGVC
jgi:hypothetical protein